MPRQQGLSSISGMKLSQLLVANRTSKGGNLSESLHFAPGILDAFVPGYGLISKFILEAFGFDIGIVVSVCLLVVGFYTSFKYFGRSLRTFCDDYLVTSVHFDDHDDLYRNVLSWIAEQHVSKRARRLKAVSKYGSTHSDEDPTYELDDTSGELFHFGKWAAKMPPRYEPSFGTYHFWYQRRFFIFERSRRERQSMSIYGSRNDEEFIRLKTVGFSTRPIKRLLQHVKKWSVERETAKTTIRRPTPKEARNYRGNPWGVITIRHSRPMDTVVLDESQKHGIIADINEFLSPATPRWYATRGIPYRRGYLFFGPPGTGKSSLSFALAGLFGLDIHVISLLEPTLTEGDLNHLFNTLPKRCIVLLEDIDTAGLKREERGGDDDHPKEKDGGSRDDGKDDKVSVSELAKELKRQSRRSGHSSSNSDDPAKQGISLSGLLNAIDGVASHEGRVLVMTTNHPEKLDPALVRPGRVDMQIRFSLASKHQIREIFFRMYWSDKDQGSESQITRAVPDMSACRKGAAVDGEEVKMNGHANGTPKAPSPAGEKLTAVKTKRLKHHAHSRDEIREMAAEFADTVPEDQFSPAEIQNYLITRKKEPRRAVEEVEAWKEEALQIREKDRGLRR